LVAQGGNEGVAPIGQVQGNHQIGLRPGSAQRHDSLRRPFSELKHRAIVQRGHAAIWRSGQQSHAKRLARRFSRFGLEHLHGGTGAHQERSPLVGKGQSSD
jgi:hypothetical protein